MRISDWSSDVCSSDLPPSIRPGTDAGAGSPVSSRLAFSQGSCVTASTLAFVFPGQGSQSLAMLAELSELHPLVREAFVEASDGAGVDLWALSPEIGRASGRERGCQSV